MSEIGHIKTERISIEKLNPAEYNPRVITDKAREGLSNSIKAFGLLQPIIWNKQTGNVVGGHQRLYDIISQGALETDVIVVDFPLAKEKAANIALNHTGIAGEYDQDKLQDLLASLDMDVKVDLNFDELALPEWTPLTDVEKGEYADANVAKITVQVMAQELTLEIKELLQRTLADHYSEDQVTVL